MGLTSLIPSHRKYNYLVRNSIRKAQLGSCLHVLRGGVPQAPGLTALTEETRFGSPKAMS
jgi:hypothetical protein